MILEACFLLHLGWIKFTEDLGLGFNHGMLLEERYTLFGGFLFNSLPLNVLMKQSQKCFGKEFMKRREKRGRG